MGRLIRRTSSQAWIIWILAAAFFFYKYLLQVSPSVMSSELMQAFSIHGFGLGHLAACYFYAYLLMQIPVGILLDRYGVRLVTSLAIAVAALGTACFAESHTLLEASISRGLMGLGAAFAAVSCFKIASVYFSSDKFALIAGLSMTAAMIGAIGGEAPLSYFVHTIGWRSTLLYTALLGAALCILFFWVTRKPTAQANPTLSPDAAAPSPRVWKNLKKLAQHPQTWLLSLYSGLAFAPVSVFTGLWGVPFLETAHEISRMTAASAASITFVGFAIGCPISGWLSDKFGQRKIFMTFGTWIALTTLSAVIYLPFMPTALLYTLMFLFGLGASCFFLCFSMIREIHPLLLAGTVLGFMNTFDSICEALSEPLIGKVLDMNWAGTLSPAGIHLFSIHAYHIALSLLPIYFVVSLMTLYFIRETHCKQI